MTRIKATRAASSAGRPAERGDCAETVVRDVLARKRGRGYVDLMRLRADNPGCSLRDLAAAMSRLAGDGLAEPVMSSRRIVLDDGASPSRWRLVPGAAGRGGLSWLSPALLASEYHVRHREEVLRHRDALESLGAWLEGERPSSYATPRERALEIFHDEKALESANGRWSGLPGVIRGMGVTDETLMIRREHATFEVVAGRAAAHAGATVLVSENRDPWMHVRAGLARGEARVLGQRVDACAYGRGNDVTSRGGLDLLESLSVAGIDGPRILYWGDVDRAGLDIASRLREGIPSADVRPFAAAYELMLARARGAELPRSDDARQCDPSALASFLTDGGWLPEPLESALRGVLRENERVPQEIVRDEDLWREGASI